MPQYQNDTSEAVSITNLAGETVTIQPGQTVTTFELSDVLTELDPAPYWSPAAAVHTPSGSGDLSSISVDEDCQTLEVWNDSPAQLSLRLRSSEAQALVIPPYASRRIAGPYSLAFASVADSVLMNVSEAVTEGQLIVTELRDGGE